MEHKLDCCVVRDLLPAYLEGLTEEETTRQVEAHLEECPECRRHREAMQASLPVVRAPKRALAFLKKVKRTRLIAAVLSAVVALLLIFLVYDSEYHWRGDLPSLTQGLQDYLAGPIIWRLRHRGPGRHRGGRHPLCVLHLRQRGQRPRCGGAGPGPQRKISVRFRKLLPLPLYRRGLPP